MELRYPFLIILIIVLIIVYFLLSKNKKNIFTIGTKIANTNYIKNTKYYKKKRKEYNIIKKILILIFVTSITCCTILIARLTKIETNNIEQYNRDIFLCMDVSNSVDELNVELVDSLKDTVNELQGERFGISIFNTSSVVLVPLTDDYDYVINILNEIQKSIESKSSTNYSSYSDDDYFYVRNYIYSGTSENNLTRGSSLIGDGLASCVYNFSNLDEERTRIIIFSTDNDLQGTPLVTLDEAADISKSKNIKVFGIGTKFMTEHNKSDFKSAVEKTGGKFYEHSTSTVNNIVNDIELTSKSLLKNQIETKKTDIPQIPFILLIISIIGIITISRKVVTWKYFLLFQYGLWL